MTLKLNKNLAKRDGITLLFVISMVVLFLLMGTTFMLVANDYYKASRNRAVAATHTVDSVGLLDRCFYDLLRGPSLSDTSSPLRGHSILADQYGYGIYGSISAVNLPTDTPDNMDIYPVPDPGTFTLPPNILDGPFVSIYLSAANMVTPQYPKPLRPIRTPAVVLDIERDLTYVDGIYAGRVLSITSGQLKGYSGRILWNKFIPSPSTTPNPLENVMEIVLLQDGLAWETLSPLDDVIINGSEFSGRGAGDLTNFGTTLAGLLTYTPDLDPGGLGMNSIEVNQSGAAFSSNGTLAGAINQDITGYLASDQSPNESWDAPDHQNLFLGGQDDLGNPIPSFHRDRVLRSYLSTVTGPLTTAEIVNIGQYSLRPFYVRDPAGPNLRVEPDFPPEPAPGSTASFAFFETSLPVNYNDIDSSGDISAQGTLNASFTANDPEHLDVDADGDGVLDSVWIDIGLPTQTDQQGRRFRPMVAYRVVDMDGRLNINATGSLADVTMGVPGTLRGTGYGVAEISPRDFVGVGLYPSLLNQRYATAGLTDDFRPGPRAADTGLYLSRNQKQIGYPSGAYVSGTPETLVGNSFSTAADLFGQLSLSSATATTMPEYAIPSTPLAGVATANPYRVNFSLSGSPIDSLYTATELEAILRAADGDAPRIPTRLATPGGTDLIPTAKRGSVTTHSFEIARPATTGSLVVKLNKILADAGIGLAARNSRIQELIPRECLLGGKLDINRALGNGADDDSPADRVVDNESVLGGSNVAEESRQRGLTAATFPTLDLDQGGDQETGDSAARQILAKDLYVTALLACGHNPPTGFTLSTGGSTTDAYRRMIAQWAVNIVDFRDADSIMTQFSYDLTPFDGSPWTPTEVVWGAERPELLITETFASHDRRNEDSSAGGGDVSSGDNDWDSVQAPQAAAFFELFHPWDEANAITRDIPDELGTPGSATAATGVDLAATAPGGSPVWRMAFKRDRTDASFVRAVYFNGAGLVTPDVTGDYFFRSGTVPATVVEPGQHIVIGSTGIGGTTTFGRLTGAAIASVDQTRGVVLTEGVGNSGSITRRFFDTAAGNVTDSTPVSTNVVLIGAASTVSRSFNISDPDGGGYEPLIASAGATVGPVSANANENDGFLITPPLDEPLDSNANASDVDAIWNNGVTDNFRIVYLQRLANPQLSFDATSNPYMTIDTAGVDLIAYNGLSSNPSNGPTTETGSAGARVVTDGDTDLKTVERGESIDPAVPEARKRNLFASDEGLEVTLDATLVAGDGHNVSYAFTHTLGALNTTYGGTTNFGWLTWNNRPFSSGNEIANVPYMASEWLCYFTNNGYQPAPAPAPTSWDFTGDTDAIELYETMAYFSNTDQEYKHLLRFGQNNEVTATFGGVPHPVGVTVTAAAGTANRMVNIFDYIEVPNKFLGSETFLGIDRLGNAVNGAATFGPGSATGVLAFEAPFHSVPNFRVPGKLNINTMTDMDIWDAVFGSPATLFGGVETFAALNAFRGTPGPTSPSDFDGAFKSGDGGQFYSPGMLANKANAGGTLFADDGTGVGEFDYTPLATDPAKDEVGSAYFRNEVRQRLGSMVTTRSSVFSVWITVGFFEVDEFGRVGAEIGSFEGLQTRHRAFYMIDRSIPVAFEPGKDHNVDETILVRTIIE